MTRFDGVVCVFTGAARGIGSMIASSWRRSARAWPSATFALRSEGGIALLPDQRGSQGRAGVRAARVSAGRRNMDTQPMHHAQGRA